MADMHETRGSLAVVALHGKVYALGGGKPQTNLDSIEVRRRSGDAPIIGHPRRPGHSPWNPAAGLQPQSKRMGASGLRPAMVASASWSLGGLR